MKTVKLAVKSGAKASRIELFVRIIWLIAGLIVLNILKILALICAVIQILVILITGKRNMALNGVIRMYYTYLVRFDAYVYLLTDERNPLLPEA